MMTFGDLAHGQYFIDRYRRLAQKTSARCARYGAGPVYHWRSRELAIPVSAGGECPYMKTHYRKESQ